MKIQSRLCFLAVLYLPFVAVGCHDVTSPTSKTIIQPQSVLAKQLVADGQDLVSEPLFDLAVDIRGDYSPNSVVKISATSVARAAAGKSTLTILLPDMPIDESPLTARRIAPIAVVQRTAAAVGGTLNKGQSIRAEGTVVFKNPGLYRIWIFSERSDPSLVRSPNGYYHQRDQIERWILVSENGGTVYETAPRAFLPDTMQFRPGPRLWQPRGAKAFIDGARGKVVPSLLPSVTPSKARGNFNSGITVMPLPAAAFSTGGQRRAIVSAAGDPTKPLSNATVHMSWYWIPMAVIVSEYDTQADANGYFNLTCENLPASSGFVLFVSVRLDNGDLFVNNGEETYQETDSTCVQGSSNYSFTDTQSGSVFANLMTTIGISRSTLSKSRGKVRIDMAIGSGAYYSTSDDRISVGRDRATGSDGIFTVAHEYGHALHWTSMGGFTSGTCPGAHYLDGEYNENCAYTEGFADWHAVATRGTDTGGWYTLIASGFPTANANKSEGGFAAFLLDIVDASGDEPWDNVQYSMAWVADVITTCQIQAFSIWRHALTVQPLIWCMQGGVNASDQSTYFAGSYFTDAFTSALPPESNPTLTNKIRPAWLYNLKNVY